MNIPKIVLREGDTVDFYKSIGGETVELSGKIVSISKSSDGTHVRTLRNLCYSIKEDGCDTIYKQVHHENVQQTIICPDCKCDLLDYGVEEKVWKAHRYDKEAHKSYNEFCDLSEDPYRCSCCGFELDEETIGILRKYLDI